MAAYRRVYDSRHLRADCQEPGSAPKPDARQSSTGYLYLFNATVGNNKVHFDTQWNVSLKSVLGILYSRRTNLID